MSLFLLLISHAQYQQEHFENAIKELRTQAQVSTDIITDIQDKKKLIRIPELLYRLEKIDNTVSLLKEIHKNQH